MKTGWQQFATRKDKLETIAGKSSGLTGEQKALAWDRLMERLNEMSSPEFPRLPRFNDVLLAVVAAQCRAKRENLYDDFHKPDGPNDTPNCKLTHIYGDEL